MGANLMGVNDAATGHALVERHQRIGTALDKPPKDRHMAVKNRPWAGFNICYRHDVTACQYSA